MLRRLKLLLKGFKAIRINTEMQILSNAKNNAILKKCFYAFQENYF
jgi:hypothetical protein